MPTIPPPATACSQPLPTWPPRPASSVALGVLPLPQGAGVAVEELQEQMALAAAAEAHELAYHQSPAPVPADVQEPGRLVCQEQPAVAHSPEGAAPDHDDFLAVGVVPRLNIRLPFAADHPRLGDHDGGDRDAPRPGE